MNHHNHKNYFVFKAEHAEKISLHRSSPNVDFDKFL